MSVLRVEQARARRLEDLESFRHRARAFIRSNLRQVTPEELRLGYNGLSEELELAAVARDRELQRMLFDAGLAGICFPRAYGGQGLTPEHQKVLNEELVGYEYPLRMQVPNLSPCATVILEFGTEEQKLRHLPAILKGEELWMQFLSEPSGGSDVAGALTTAVRDGDQWVLNGSKVWTHGRLVVRLGPVPRPDQLGRPQAPGPDGVHAADPPAEHRGAPDRDVERLAGVLPGVHDRRDRSRHGPRRRRRRRAGPWSRAGCSTSACSTTRPTSPSPSA